MKWKIFLLSLIVVSLSLSIVSWYYTSKIDYDGWRKWLMIIISLALSLVALIALIFPLGMAMEEPGSKGLLVMFIVFGVLFMLTICYLIYYPDIFIDNTRSWGGLAFFGGGSILSFKKYLKEKKDETIREKLSKHNEITLNKILTLIEKGDIENAINSIDEFKASSWYEKPKAVKSIGIICLKNKNIDLCIKVLKKIPIDDQREVLIDFLEECINNSWIEYKNKILTYYEGTINRDDELYLIHSDLEKLIELNEFQVAKKIISEVKCDIDDEYENEQKLELLKLIHQKETSINQK
jgi:hypothetical protein